MVTDASSLHLMRGRARLKGVTVGRLETATRRGLSDRVLDTVAPVQQCRRRIPEIALLSAATCASVISRLSPRSTDGGSSRRMGPIRPHPHAGQGRGSLGAQKIVPSVTGLRFSEP